MSESVVITLREAEAARITAGRLVIRAKHHFDLSKRHCALIDALTMESLSQGSASVVIPSSQVLTELSGVPVQHVPNAIEELISMHIIKRTGTPDGMWRYVVNPDSDAWRVRPVVGIEAARAARSLVATINGRERDSLPANFKACECIPAFCAPESCGRTCGAQEFPTSHLTKQA